MAEAVELDGAEELRRRVRNLPKVANASMRTAAKGIVEKEVPRIQAAAGSNKQARMVASTIRARSDRYPTIVAGGSRRLSPSRKTKGKGRPTAGEVFFGAEFGGAQRPTTQQFRPYQGRRGYFFWPTLRKDAQQIGEQWEQAITAVEQEWSSDGRA